MPSLFLSSALASFLIANVLAISKLEDQSFQAPFTDYNSNGQRITASYREGGQTKINEHFIRLTPDRQSKRGHLWSSRQIDVQDWSVVLEFRVSGQGKTLFGDGLAFWFTDMPNIRPGEVFGVIDDFKGFSVIFDTFRNQEFLSVHKDISVLTGDGNPGAGDRRNTERAGCDADFRYYEGADNFDVAKSLSYAKISLKGRTLKVSIDPKADGNFKACFETSNVLPADFDISKGFFGLTATTGGLADNHDVLGMNAYKLDAMDQEGPTPELHFSKQAPEALPAHETVGDPNYDPESALRSLISTEKKISKQEVNDVKHYVEHQMSAVKDELKKVIGKVDERVSGNRKHANEVDGLIEKIQQEVQDQITNAGSEMIRERIDQLVKVMNTNIEMRLKALEKKLDLQSESIEATIKRTTIAHVEKQVKGKADELAASFGGSSTWIYAFMLMGCIFSCLFLIIWKKISSSGGSMGILGGGRKGSWKD